MKKTTLSALLMSTLSIQAATDTMVVFDASGSMWGQIEGKTKIEIARTAVSDISKSFAVDQAVGLMAYGHRRKGDCGDIETLVPPAKSSAADIQHSVSALQPKGKTPLSQAVKMAAEQLKYRENKAEVVLITDGIETCDLDPCAVATELENLGIDFKAHVIGFGLSDDQGKQVACMADITGGQYVAAADAAGLNQALNQVIVAAEEPVAVELPDATVTLLSESVVIGAGFTVGWSGPAGKNDYIDVVNQGDERVYGELTYAWTKDGEPAQLSAPGKPGTYDLRYVWQGPVKKHVLATTSIEVKDSEVSLVAPAKVNAGEYFDVMWTGPDRKDDYVDLVKQGDNRTFGELSYFYTNKAPVRGSIQAPAEPGSYDIRYVLQANGGREILHRIPVQVSPVEVTLAFEPSVEVVQPFSVFWTGPNNKDGYIDMVKAGDKRTYGEISYFYLKDAPDSGELLAPVDAGEYDVRFIMDGAGGRKIIATSPIKVVAVPATIEAPSSAAAGSTITVNWQGPSRPDDYIDLIKAEKNTLYGEVTYFYTKNSPEAGMLVMPDEPGAYKIRYVLQGKKRKILAEQAITVK
ncbi:VWA domain-containing protein [Marinicella sp. S1101]|uniref:vWA domain-containing protein n=1 Tax=Marinicella marina TaxID=2996016 RepID=UPI002260D49B|nr:VWA domain-containing protein [Marinicella marina]MCX7553140.1 VWA domain-containing protein [Marinicella marina]MDJ1138872.1 VWA domain-containing protein [Marinicella marina]